MAKRPIRHARRLSYARRSAQISSLLRGDKLDSLKEKPRSLKKGIKTVLKKAIIKIETHPFLSFFTVLAVLFLLILVGSFLRRPEKEIAEKKQPIDVKVYSIGKAPTISVSAQVEKSGVVKIVALTPGVVSQINIEEGQEISQGTTLIGLSTNYGGGNAADVQRQIAQNALSNVQDTYQQQKDIIPKQRDLADKNRDNAEQLRQITLNSLSDTRSLLDFNQGIVDSLNSNLQNLQNTNAGGANDTAILQTKQLISQFQSGVNQLRSQVKNAEYQTDTDKSPNAVADLTRDITKKQLDVQERALQMSLESSKLQLQLAQIQEATMFPSAPFSGTVERVYVHVGDSVNPGTPLALLHGAQTVKIIAKVPSDIARKISYSDPASIHIGRKTYKEVPAYISNEATDGNLYSVIFTLADEFQNMLSNNENIKIDLPVGIPSTTIADPFIPIDSVYQSQSSSYIFVSKDGKVASKTVELGSVIGEYVEVLSGIANGDKVILDRNVVAGDSVHEIQ